MHAAIWRGVGVSIPGGNCTSAWVPRVSTAAYGCQRGRRRPPNASSAGPAHLRCALTQGLLVCPESQSAMAGTLHDETGTSVVWVVWPGTGGSAAVGELKPLSPPACGPPRRVPWRGRLPVARTGAREGGAAASFHLRVLPLSGLISDRASASNG